RAPARSLSEPDDFTWREERQGLHEEVNKVAERERGALAACYLVGKAGDEAAAALGLAKNALKERVARPREQRRVGLVARGRGRGGRPGVGGGGRSRPQRRRRPPPPRRPCRRGGRLPRSSPRA